jgi:hypothetical protein
LPRALRPWEDRAVGRLDELDLSLKLGAAALVLALAPATAGCGEDEDALPRSCLAGPAQVSAALRTAPGEVALPGGARLSTCVERARGDADIQAVGAALTGAADDLAARVHASDGAALQLGYLVGAARRGARDTAGIHEELVRRLEQAAGVDGAPARRRAAYRRGLAAGQRHG